MDEIWAEGGAIIDHAQRTLLWYGGEDTQYDVPRRRLHLKMMGAFWPGWTSTLVIEHTSAFGRGDAKINAFALRDDISSLTPDDRRELLKERFPNIFLGSNAR